MRSKALGELAMKESDDRWNETNERLRYSVEYAQAGIKGLFLANGAAIISLLTFLGNTSESVQERGMAWAFGWFTLGLTSALLAYFAGYFSQEKAMQAVFRRSRQAQSDALELGKTYDFETPERHTSTFVTCGVVSAFGALGFFVAGAFVALYAVI